MSSSPSSRNLTQGPIASTLFFFTLPVLGGNILQTVNGSINSVWVGHYLGEAALTATSNANAILFFLIGTIFGLSMAANIMVGQALGAGDRDEAKRVVGTSVSFFAAIEALVTVLGLVFVRSILETLHTPEDALPYAVSYLSVLFVSVPMLFTFSFIMMVLRGSGDSRTPFRYLCIAVVIDIALNPLFIFGFGPIPALGIRGSALATLVAQTTALALIIVHLYRTGHFLCIRRGETRYLRVDPRILRALVFKGIPMGLQMIVVSTSVIMIASFVNRFGSETSAAFGACMLLWNYIQMPAMAVGMAVSSMAAQNVGARLWDRVARIASTGVVFNFAMTGALVTVVYLANPYVVGLFLPAGAHAIETAAHINVVACWSFIFFGVGFVLAGVMRAAGAVSVPLVTLCIALWVCRLPFAYWGMERFGADAVWWSFPLGSGVWMALSIAYYRFGNWRAAPLLVPAGATPVGPATPVALGHE